MRHARGGPQTCARVSAPLLPEGVKICFTLTKRDEMGVIAKGDYAAFMMLVVDGSYMASGLSNFWLGLNIL